MEEGDGGHDEEAGLAQGQHEPQTSCGAGVRGSFEARGIANVFHDGFPYEDGQSKDVAQSQPYVALVRGGQRAEVRKAELGLCACACDQFCFSLRPAKMLGLTGRTRLLKG